LVFEVCSRRVEHILSAADGRAVPNPHGHGAPRVHAASAAHLNVTALGCELGSEVSDTTPDEGFVPIPGSKPMRCRHCTLRAARDRASSDLRVPYSRRRCYASPGALEEE